MKNHEVFFTGSFCEIRPEWLKSILNTCTGKGVKVGIVDSGWDYSLVDDRIKKGIGLVNPEDELLFMESSDFNDQNGHGTSCTDLILRIAPDVEIYPVKVFGKKLETSVNILCEAIKWSAKENLNILNFSLGTLITGSLEPLYVACEYARRKGIIIIAANTNEPGVFSYPAIFENSIGVKHDFMNSFFDFNFYREEAIECVANGSYDNICSLGGTRIKSMGNSFAAPVITGIVALALEKNPEYRLSDVRNFLSNLSNNITPSYTH